MIDNMLLQVQDLDLDTLLSIAQEYYAERWDNMTDEELDAAYQQWMGEVP